MIKTNNFLIDPKFIPDKSSEEYNKFWKLERQKCKEGILIDGVFINPFLYWHCNLWTIVSDHITKGRVKQKPTLRDSEWVVSNKIWEAETWKDSEGNLRKKGIIAAGTRRFSKSEQEASFCAWKSVIWKNAQVVVSGLNEADIKIITDKIDLGINELPDFFMKTKIEDNWKKQVTLGIKEADGTRNPWSSFAIRNFDQGNNEEALAGLTPSGGVIDEGGKGKFLKALIAGLPGLTTPNGWRGTFLVMGTGGDMDNFQDFQTLFDDPETYNFLSCYIPEENRTCGVFLPGWMSYAYPKEKKNLAEFLNLDPLTHPNLAKVEILASNKEKNEKIIDEERLKAAKSNDSSALLKHTMYFPKNTREIFMSDSNNNFPIEACKMQQAILLDKYEPRCVEFFRDRDSKVKTKFSQLKPINKFPVTPTDPKDAPVVLYEDYIEGLPFGTYVIGIDPYNEDSSTDKVNSLGSVYVLKRMYNPMGEFQNCMVASWTGRFNEVKKFHQLCVDMAEYYNAVGSVLPENADKTLIQFFEFKKKSHFLTETFDLAKTISINTKSGRKVGLAPTPGIQKHYMNLEYEYTKEEISSFNTEGFEEITLGVTRILDPMLLEEMIKYKGKKSSTGGVHDGNYDRIISFGHALTLMRYFDNLYPLTNWKSADSEKDNQENHKRTHIKTVFGEIGSRVNSPFSKSKPIKHSGRSQFI